MKYHGKSKCCCRKRATQKGIRNGHPIFTCDEHSYLIEGENVEDRMGHLTEADYQTWLKL